MLRLDANMLRLLAADPQKFQQDFIEPQCLLTPSNLVEDQKEIERFRLVLQQLLLGLPVEPLLQADPKIASWIDRVLPIATVPALTHEMRNEIQIVKPEIRVEGRCAGSRQEKMTSLAFGIEADYDVRNNDWHYCSRD